MLFPALRLTALAWLLASLAVFSSSVQASVQIVRAFDNGWYENDGFSNPENPNIILNACPPIICGVQTFTRSFFAFDLSALGPQEVTSVSVTFLPNGQSIGSVTKTFGVFDYVGSIDSLVSPTGLSIPTYEDLGSGDLYASITVNIPNYTPMPQLTYLLGANAVEDINIALARPDRRFAFGLAYTQVNLGGWQMLWAGSSEAPAAFLSIEQKDSAVVPAPNTIYLMVAALAIPLLGALRLYSSGHDRAVDCAAD